MKQLHFLFLIISILSGANVCAQGTNVSALKKAYLHAKTQTMQACIDLINCDAERIRSKELLLQFMQKLCAMLVAQRSTDATVLHTNTRTAAGYTLIQLLDNQGRIMVHCTNRTNGVQLDVIVPNAFDASIIAQFAQNFFNASRNTLTVVTRSE